MITSLSILAVSKLILDILGNIFIFDQFLKWAWLRQLKDKDILIAYSQWLLSPNPWWRHQMETFSALLALYAGKSSVTGEFPAQRPVTRSFDVFYGCAWINGWVNIREAGDLRLHRAHYDVILMLSKYTIDWPRYPGIFRFITASSHKLHCVSNQRQLFTKGQ